MMPLNWGYKVVFVQADLLVALWLDNLRTPGWHGWPENLPWRRSELHHQPRYFLINFVSHLLEISTSKPGRNWTSLTFTLYILLEKTISQPQTDKAFLLLTCFDFAIWYLTLLFQNFFILQKSCFTSPMKELRYPDMIHYEHWDVRWKLYSFCITLLVRTFDNFKDQDGANFIVRRKGSIWKIL